MISKLHFHSIFFLILLTPLACSSLTTSPKKDFIEEFTTLAHFKNDQIWSPVLSSKTRQAIYDYNHKKKLNSGKIYGNSVRHYDVRNKCPTDIEQEMVQLGCQRKEDVLKDPKTNKPLMTHQLQTIPMVAFICPDGGVVRLKPQGDPMNKYRAQPSVSKVLRYPFNSKFENFTDEVAKIDNFGNIIPKWAKDLNPNLGKLDEKSKLVQAWADDAHTDLRLDCNS